MIATLTVISGPMFAGKTSALIRDITAALNDGLRPVVIVKPAMDIRYGEAAIVTHDGVAHPALPVASERDLFAAVGEAAARAQGPAHVFIDEMQFMEAPHFAGSLHEAVHALLVAGHNVTAGGLDTDWRGLPFDVSARLLAMADHVQKLTARCTVTGLPAQKTYKKTADASRIALGAADTYEARANEVWEGVERKAAATMPRRAENAG
jgi:thymidine kinase